MEWIVKIILCSGLFWVFYKVLLQKEKIFGFNRYFLLTAFLLSVAIPFMRINKSILPEKTVFPADESTVNISQDAASIVGSIQAVQTNTIAAHPGGTPSIWESLDFENTLLFLYIFISAGFLLRFSVNLSQIIKKIRSNRKIKTDDCTFVLCEKGTLPFSFLNFMFVRQNDFKNNRIEKDIYEHELAHIRQKHSRDILAMEILTLFLWFNPFTYLYKNEIRLNHEFLADREALKNHSQPLAYKQLIISRAAGRTHLLSSSFSYKSTKKRIIMISKTPSKFRHFFLQILSLPILALGIFLFSQPLPAQQSGEGEGVSKKEMRQFKRSVKKIEKQIDKAQGGTLEFEIKEPGKLLEIYEKMSPEQRESLPELSLPEISIDLSKMPSPSDIQEIQIHGELTESSGEIEAVLKQAQVYYDSSQPFYEKAMEYYKESAPFYTKAQELYVQAQTHYQKAQTFYEKSRINQLTADNIKREIMPFQSDKTHPEYLRLKSSLESENEHFNQNREIYKAEMKIYGEWMKKYGSEMEKYGSKMADYNGEMGKYSKQMVKYGKEMEKYARMVN